MIAATKWKTSAMLALLASIGFFSAGCGTKSGSSDQQVKVEPKKTEEGNAKAAPYFVASFLKELSDGKTSGDALTESFKKKLSRPRPGIEEDKKLGYNPIAVDSYLKKLQGDKYEETLKFGNSAAGPFFFGTLKTAKGQTEHYFLHLIPSKDEAGWKVDWFHHTTVSNTVYTADDPGAELIGAQLAAHCFLENLIGGDLSLAAAMISRKWKVREYASSAPSDADLGYNPALVLQKLRGWKDNNADFSFTQRAVGTGKPAVFEGLFLDSSKKPGKDFTLKVGKDDSGEWKVEEIEIK